MANKLYDQTKQGTRVLFDENTAATHTVLAGTAGSSIRVLDWDLYLAAANTVTWNASTGGVQGSAWPYAAGSWVPNTREWFQIPAGEDLELILGSAAQVVGAVWYELVS